MMNFKMRPAESRDIERLCFLMEELSGHRISEQDMGNRLSLARESSIDTLYVCECDDVVAGLLAFRIRNNMEEVSKFGEIAAIVVDPLKRKTGMGKFMVQYAKQLAREAGCIGLWLVSGFGREEAAHAFYKRMGLTITGYRFVEFFQADAK